MPRRPRIEFEGAFYHVITRGNQRRKIFKGPADYEKYLSVLTHMMRLLNAGKKNVNSKV